MTQNISPYSTPGLTTYSSWEENKFVIIASFAGCATALAITGIFFLYRKCCTQEGQLNTFKGIVQKMADKAASKISPEDKQRADAVVDVEMEKYFANLEK